MLLKLTLDKDVKIHERQAKALKEKSREANLTEKDIVALIK